MILKGDELFVSAILPLPVFVALKLVMVLALPNVVPPTEEVVKRAPLMVLAPASDIVLADVSVTLLPDVEIPFTVPRSSVKFVTESALLDANDIAPVNDAAILVKTLLVLASVAPVESRSIKPLEPKLIGAFDVCVIEPPELNVTKPVANVAAGVQVEALVPIVMFPAVLLPMRTLVARILSSAAAVSAKLPVPPATPIVLDAVLGVTITVAALPAPAPVPPTCEVALKATKSEVRLIVLVPNNNELAFNVRVPVPALSVILPDPVAMFVLAAFVKPTLVIDTGKSVVVMVPLDVYKPPAVATRLAPFVVRLSAPD